ncbi:MAG: hypothetical protein QM796_16675 [Chthoniobacteraceae bacterium]
MSIACGKQGEELVTLISAMARRLRVRQNPVGSFFGGIAGIVFVCLGIFFIIPSFGAFGYLWTIIALGITIGNFYNAFSERGIATEIIEVSDETQPAANDLEGRLQRLDHLLLKRLITPEEHDRRRQEILREL